MSVSPGVHPPRSHERTHAAWAVAVIVLSILAAYHNSFGVPFVLDDISAIPENSSIRKLWPISAALSPPASGTTVSGRPVANLTLALNYAISGTDTWSYHAVNLVIHVLGALVLFGLVRRTLRLPDLSARFGRDSTGLALAISLLWALHPLLTESVTYVVQRVESLMGLFYLLTLYLFVRSVDSPRPARWKMCMVTACLLGMATKETMATAPIIVLLYDRTFVAGTFRSALQQRRGLYASLAATWVPLAFLAAGTGWSRGGSAGFSASISPAAYWVTQFEAVARYLLLSLWPHPLVFDYGTYLAKHAGDVALCAVLIVVLVTATAVSACRNGLHALGFLGAWIFVILAPSSVVPVATQTIAEHRMYLPVAAVMALLVLGIHSIAGRRGWLLMGALAAGLGFLTERRNDDYRTDLRLWSDTVLKRPGNARAHCSLGMALYPIPGRLPDAIGEFETALRIQPDYPDAQNDLGIALEAFPARSDEAIWRFREALRVSPKFAQAHYNLAIVLARAGRIPEAIQEYEAALLAQPEYAEACNNLGNLLCSIGRTAEGIQQLERALQVSPNYARAHFDLGNALVQTGKIPEAIGHFEEALRIQPNFAEANNNLGIVLCRSGRIPEGIAHIEAAIREEPNSVFAHFALGTALYQSGRRNEAATEFEKVLQLRPNDPSATRMLEQIRAAR